MNESTRFPDMRLQAKPSSAEEILPLRTRYRKEANDQIVHDWIHRREGWTVSFLRACATACTRHRANTTLFSFVNTLWLRPPPVEKPDERWQI